MPKKSPELSPEQRIAVETAVSKAKGLTDPGQEELVQIDHIQDKATRMFIISALQDALRNDEELGGGVVASLFSNGNEQFLRVSTPVQPHK
jgi:hypothetical protein